ncbi:Uncharacterised protein [uncultured Clostridium sp.]|nr:Uncharacterised protein [uncultured Clostridium sp.]
MDDLSIPGTGHHAVGHVEEEGIQLVALVLHLAQSILKLVRHVVEGIGQHSDLIPRGHLDLPGKVPFCHPHGPLRQPLYRGNHRLGQQEGQQHRDDQAKDQGLHDQEKHFLGQAVGSGLVVQDVDDIALVPPVDGDGQVHIIGGQIALIPHLVGLQPGIQGKIQVLGIFQYLVLPLRSHQAHSIAVQDIQLAVAPVHPQHADIGVQHIGHSLRTVLLIRSFGGQVGHQAGVAEHVGHLAIKILQIKGGHRVDQEGPHHHHQGQDQQHHDHDQLHMQTTHGAPPFVGTKSAFLGTPWRAFLPRSYGAGTVISLAEKIAHSPLGADELGVGRIVLDLLS